MCYDSSTTPKTLCNDPSYFTNIGYFTTPSSVCLGDDDTAISALGQGTIDIIINNKYIIQQHAILTKKTPTALMSTQDHIRYHDCSVVRSNNNLHISFPTFSFVTTRKSRFEFDISPGKASSLLILWSPAPELLCTSINIAKNISILPLTESFAVPIHGTPNSTGYDIATSTTITIPATTTTTVPLGFAMSFPSDLACNLQPRSSLSSLGLQISIGLIDPDYRGEIMAIASNITNYPITITTGQHIGQLVFTQASHPPITIAHLSLRQPEAARDSVVPVHIHAKSNHNSPVFT